MSIKTILIPFLQEKSGRSLFETALTFATRYRAHMRFVHLWQPPVPPGGYAYPVAMTYVQASFKELEAAVEQQARDMETLFHQLCEKHGVPVLAEDQHSGDKGATASWTVLKAEPPYGYTGMARLADLIVLEKPETGSPLYQMGLVEELLFQSGRPALLLGAEESLPAMPQTVAVAWNGSREAARALAAAMPVLEQAKLVDVVTVGHVERHSESPDHVATYLRLHGIHVEVSRLDPKKAAETVFLDHARERKAELIVMGAYSHNRWREVVLGGFTRQMMTEPSLPVLMTH